MKRSKLIQLIQACEKSELSSLEDFIVSPYFNRDESATKLFVYLKSFYPEFSDKSLTKQHVFSHLFPNSSFDDKQMRYLMSKLKKLIERFFAVHKMEQHPYHSNLALVESLSERGLETTYQQANRDLDKKLRVPEDNSSDFFWAHLHQAEIKVEDFQRKRLRKFDTNIQSASNYLDRYYFLHRLKLTCAMLDRQTIFQQSYQLNISSDWIRHLEEQQFFNEPIIQLYYTIFEALRNEKEEKHFADLKNYLNKSYTLIPAAELENIYLFAINYCARKIRQGKDTYLAEALNLYRSGIATGLLIEKGILSPWTFTNVVKLSLRLQEYDWIEAFIPQYAPMLPDTFQRDALHYNLAELYYYTKRLEQAQEHLIQVSFSDMNYYLGARVLLAKIYYEMEEEEPLLSLIASFTIFLKRNKQLSNNIKQTYLNFCDILFQIIRRNPRRMKQLNEKIESTKLLTDRRWLASIYEVLVPRI